MKKLFLAVAALALLLLGFSLVILLMPGKPVSTVDDTARPAAEVAAASDAPDQAAVLSPAAEVAPTAQQPVPPTSARSVAEPLPAVQLVGDWKSSERRSVRGVVVLPPDVPADPTLTVLALSRELTAEQIYGDRGAAGQFARSRAGFDRQREGDLLKLASARGHDHEEIQEKVPEGAADGDLVAPEAPAGEAEPTGSQPLDLAAAGLVALAPVAADGSFELPFPPEQDAGWIALDGRYLYSAKPLAVDFKSPGDVQLVPDVGAWLTGHVTLPAGAGDPAASYAGIAIVLGVDPSAVNVFDMAGLSSLFERLATPNAEGHFEFRGVGSKPSYRLFVRSHDFAHQALKGLVLGDGKDKYVEIAMVQGADVRGRVVDESGAPVAKAGVRAATGSIFGFATDRVASGTTDDDGLFALSHVTPGKVQFLVEKDTYLESAPKTLQLADLEAREGLLFELSRGASVGGRVTNPDGSPAAEVDVDVDFDPDALASMAALNAARGADGEAKTDGDGRFVITGLGKGPFLVTASTKAADVTQAARVSGVKPGALDLALVLKPAPALRGFVVTNGGAPVTAFSVHAQLQTAAFWLGAESEMREFTDETGAFEIPGLKEGKWRVQASAEGLASSPWEDVVLPSPDGTPPLSIVLEPQALAAGRVVDPDGNPVPGATVRPLLDVPQSIANAAGGGETQETRAIEEGRFTLDGLAAGTVTLVATYPDWVESEPVTVEVRAGETTDGIELKLRTGGVLTGLVYNEEGKPAGGCMIVMQRTSNMMPIMLNSEPDGTFRRDNVMPGKWQVTAMLGDLDAASLAGGDEEEPDFSSLFKGMRIDSAEIEEGKETHLVLGAPPADPVRVTGTVVHAGEPVAKAWVTMFPENALGIGALKLSTTDSDGKFSFALDRPGKYLMSVQMVGDRAMAQDTLEFPQVIPDAEEHTIKVELPVGRVSGSVHGVDGKPAVNTRITLTVDGGIGYGSLMGGRYVETRTDAEGHFDIQYMRPGTYSIAAGGTLAGGLFGGTASEGRVVSPGIKVKEGEWVQGLDFRLKAPGEITGRVVDLTGSPVPNAAVFVRDEAGHVLERFSMITSNDAGFFTYTGVAPGRYTVSARTGDLASAESELIDVQPGGSSETVIAVDAGTRLLVSVVDDLDGFVQAKIKVEDEQGRQVNGMLSYQEIMDSAARLYCTEEETVGPLSAGRYTVTAETDDGRTVTKPVTLSGQAERKLKIRLK